MCQAADLPAWGGGGCEPYHDAIMVPWPQARILPLLSPDPGRFYLPAVVAHISLGYDLPAFFASLSCAAPEGDAEFAGDAAYFVTGGIGAFDSVNDASSREFGSAGGFGGFATDLDEAYDGFPSLGGYTPVKVDLVALRPPSTIVPTVPLPPTGWLFLAALTGFGLIKRN